MNLPDELWTIIPVSAVVSVVVTLVLRFLDKPRPVLVVTTRVVLLAASDERWREGFGLPTTLTNSGTAAAHNLRIAGSRCSVGVRQAPAHGRGTSNWASEIPVLASGETLLLDVQHCEPGARILVTHDRLPSVRLLRWSKRVWSWKVDAIGPENPLPTAAFPGVPIPLWRRVSGAIGRYGLQQRMSERRPLRVDRFGDERTE